MYLVAQKNGCPEIFKTLYGRSRAHSGARSHARALNISLSLFLIDKGQPGQRGATGKKMRAVLISFSGQRGATGATIKTPGIMEALR